MTDPSLIRPLKPSEPVPVLARVTVHLWGMAPGYTYYVDPEAPYVREKIAQGYIIPVEAEVSEEPAAPEAPAKEAPDDDEQQDVEEAEAEEALEEDQGS